MRRLRRLGGIWAATVVAAGFGVAAASAVTDAAREDEPPELAAEPGTDSIGARAPDPDGGPGWAVRTYMSTSGAVCVELGRYDGRAFGTVDENGKLRPHAPGSTGACGSLREDAAIAAVNRYVDRPGQPARTVVFGRTAERVAELRISPRAAVRREMTVARDGTFLSVARGLVEATDLPLEETFDDGSQETIDWR